MVEVPDCHRERIETRSETHLWSERTVPDPEQDGYLPRRLRRSRRVAGRKIVCYGEVLDAVAVEFPDGNAPWHHSGAECPQENECAVTGPQENGHAARAPGDRQILPGVAVQVADGHGGRGTESSDPGLGPERAVPAPEINRQIT